jgi:hypothetical protein
MAKDDRVIHSNVRMPGTAGEGGKVVQKGATISDVDELQAAADAKKVDLQRLYDRGAISGTWKGVKVPKGK